MGLYKKCSWLLMLLPLFAFNWPDTETVEKRVQREFSIKPDGRIEIDNRHGNIDIAIGPPGNVRMDILIKVIAGSKNKALETLDRIGVNFEEGNNRISATTEIEQAGGGWKSWFSTGKMNIDIRYQLQVPPDVFLDVQNKFGNIYIETTNRNLNIELAYGKLMLGDINADLSLNMAYSEGSISQIKNGEFELAYSDLEMENAEMVDMEIKFGDLIAGSINKVNLESASSDLRFISVDKMDFNVKYGNLHLETVGQLNAESAFTGIVIDQLSNAANFSMRYGELRIHQVQRTFSGININSSYTGVQLKFNPGTSYSLDAVTNYCDIVYPSSFKVTENIVKTTNRVVKGSVGSGSPLINARMNYGELRLE